MTQIRLERALGFSSHLDSFERSANYGSSGYPAYMHGYYLAKKAREALGLGLGPLDLSLRELCEDRLGIPVIQTTIGDWIAGLTVEAGNSRAIVLNTAGKNGNVFIRRSTLAHELGHLLFDPADRLEHLRVDEYEDLDRDARDIPDVVEQRANAFSVEFIAPKQSVIDVFHQRGGAPEQGLHAVVESFGLSPTAASYQIWNGLERQLPLAELKLKKLLSHGEIAPWEGKEGFAAVGYHPLKDLAMSRTGRFSAVVVRAAQEKIISWDTAASYLQATRTEVEAVIPSIQEMYPKVFEPST